MTVSSKATSTQHAWPKWLWCFSPHHQTLDDSDAAPDLCKPAPSTATSATFMHTCPGECMEDSGWHHSSACSHDATSDACPIGKAGIKAASLCLPARHAKHGSTRRSAEHGARLKSVAHCESTGSTSVASDGGLGSDWAASVATAMAGSIATRSGLPRGNSGTPKAVSAPATPPPSTVADPEEGSRQSSPVSTPRLGAQEPASPPQQAPCKEGASALSLVADCTAAAAATAATRGDADGTWPSTAAADAAADPARTDSDRGLWEGLEPNPAPTKPPSRQQTMATSNSSLKQPAHTTTQRSLDMSSSATTLRLMDHLLSPCQPAGESATIGPVPEVPCNEDAPAVPADVHRTSAQDTNRGGLYTACRVSDEYTYDPAPANSQRGPSVDADAGSAATGGPKVLSMSVVQRALASAPAQQAAMPAAVCTAAMVTRYGIYAPLVAERRNRLAGGSVAAASSRPTSEGSRNGMHHGAAPAAFVSAASSRSQGPLSTATSAHAPSLATPGSPTRSFPSASPAVAPTVSLGSPNAAATAARTPAFADLPRIQIAREPSAIAHSSASGLMPLSALPSSPLTALGEASTCAFLSALQASPVTSSAAWEGSPLKGTCGPQPCCTRHLRPTRSVEQPSWLLPVACEMCEDCMDEGQAAYPERTSCSALGSQQQHASLPYMSTIHGSMLRGRQQGDSPLAAPHTPRMSSRVESLRSKLRAQAAELKVVSEQQQLLVGADGACAGHSPVHRSMTGGGIGSSMSAGNVAGVSGGKRGMPSCMAPPSFNGRSLATMPAGAMAFPACAQEDVDEEEEEERSRHESTLSYLRMLSRSNTSFCTRLRRSNTTTHQASSGCNTSGGNRDMCSAMASSTHRSILGGMPDERV